jgi:hypothetical protein
MSTNNKPPSPQDERTVPDSPKPTSSKGVWGSPGAGGASTSPTHAAQGQDPAGASLVAKLTKSPRASPPGPQSRGLRAAGGSQHGKGLSVPQPEEVPRQRS